MRTRSRHLPKTERRAHTVDAVVQLAAEQNPSEITTAAIARRMNLTQGALFRHFESKDAVWEEVMEWVSERLLETVDRAQAGAALPLDALDAVFMAHIQFVITHPGVPRMLFSELQRAEDTPAKRVTRRLVVQYSERITALIEAGKARGDLPPDTDTSAAVTMFIGTIQGLIMQALLGGDIGRIQTDARRAFVIYRRGIGGRS